LECKKCDNAEPADFELSSLLADDHLYLDELLDTAFRSINAKDKTRVFECVDMFWARLAMHIRAEHLHLFPAIENAAKVPNNIVTAAAAKKKIESLHNDHDIFMRKMIDAIKHLRSRPNDLEPVKMILKEIQERLCEHNKTEETEVYLWAKDLLSAKDHKELEYKMLKEITNLPPRFSV
jgi:hemerythrin superfamily protein